MVAESYTFRHYPLQEIALSHKVIDGSLPLGLPYSTTILPQSDQEANHIARRTRAYGKAFTNEEKLMLIHYSSILMLISASTVTGTSCKLLPFGSRLVNAKTYLNPIVDIASIPNLTFVSIKLIYP